MSLPARIATPVVLALLPALAHAQEAPPVVTIPRLEAELAVDGALDEPAWEQAAVLEGFHQYQPVDSRPAQERTEVRVFYTPQAICFGILARDTQPGSIRATVADRDNIDSDDNVTIYLDTFNDRRRAFFFAVNPLGVQQDGVRTEGSNSPGQAFGGETDKSPDFVFDSKGRLAPEGYVVEVRVPFKSLRYPGGSQPMRWGLNVVRTVQRTGYVDTWTDVRRASASFLAQAGAIEGLHQLRRGLVLEAQPFATASADGFRAAGGGFDRRAVDPSAGVNLRLGLTPDVSVDGTVNPDFSQVESDVGAVTVNERFALFFPEKRPFFLEGIELFATPNQLVYTRRIADPIAGGKVTAKRGRWNVAHLTAVDDTLEGDALFNVSRVRADYGHSSTAGLTLTDRALGGDRNTVLAADTRFVFGRLYFLRGQIGGSRTTLDGGPAVTAPLWQLEFDRTGRSWGFNYEVNGIGRHFDAQAGFVPRSDVVQAHAFNRASFYGAPGALVEQLTFFAGPEWVWGYGGFLSERALEGEVGSNVEANLRGGWELRGRVARHFLRYRPGEFAAHAVDGRDGPYRPQEMSGEWVFSVSGATPALKALDGELELAWGGVPIFLEGSLGRETTLTSTLNLRGGGSLRVGALLTLSRIVRQRDGSEFARTAIPRLKVEFQPRRALFARVVAEYQALRRDALRDARDGTPLRVDGTLAGRADSNRLRVDVLLSYEPTPGTVAFLGYGSTLDNGAAFGLDRLERESDGLFVKLAYHFRR